ncbi:MAG: hypothetical protein BWY92_01089 [Firmicutes bacterium ADurb.BinA052]|nr:MAG: hypothetical protein BWY92_01089 [Firmicutes bacterium ADurb.BinA052]
MQLHTELLYCLFEPASGIIGHFGGVILIHAGKPCFAHFILEPHAADANVLDCGLKRFLCRGRACLRPREDVPGILVFALRYFQRPC